MQSTKDYKQFRHIEGNRTVSDSHVDSLVKAIERKNLLEYFPILVNENMKVIDGQHRLFAANELGVPVYYAQVEGLTIDDVMQINTTSKSWTINDFIDSYSRMGKQDYTALKDFMKLYSLSSSVAAGMLEGRVQGNRITKRVKAGDFKITHAHQAELIANQIAKLQKYAEHNLRSDRALIATLEYLHKNDNFDFEELESKMTIHESLEIHRKPSVRHYLVHIEELYNHNTHKKNYVDLYASTQSLRKEI